MEGIDLQNVVSRVLFWKAQEEDEELHTIWKRVSVHEDAQPGPSAGSHQYEVKKQLLYRVRGGPESGADEGTINGPHSILAVGVAANPCNTYRRTLRIW